MTWVLSLARSGGTAISQGGHETRRHRVRGPFPMGACLLLAGTLALAGCGSSSNSTVTFRQQLPQSEPEIEPQTDDGGQTSTQQPPQQPSNQPPPQTGGGSGGNQGSGNQGSGNQGSGGSGGGTGGGGGRSQTSQTSNSSSSLGISPNDLKNLISNYTPNINLNLPTGFSIESSPTSKDSDTVYDRQFDIVKSGDKLSYEVVNSLPRWLGTTLHNKDWSGRLYKDGKSLGVIYSNLPKKYVGNTTNPPHVHFGYWLTAPENDGDPWSIETFSLANFYGEPEDYLQRINALKGSASYSGPATGIYTIPDHPRGGSTGQFRARVTLNANWGQPSGNPFTGEDEFTITGTVKNFTSLTEEYHSLYIYDWSLDLGKVSMATQRDTDGGALFDKVKLNQGFRDGVTTGSGPDSQTGSWTGRFWAKILQHQGRERMNPWLLLESSPAILVMI